LKKKIESPDLQEFYEKTSLRFPERQSPDKQRYAQDLLKQIEEKQRKTQQEKKKRGQVANYQNLTSLNIPQTPSRLRRQREQEMQRRIKQDLEMQINEKQSQVKNQKTFQLESERKEMDYLTQKFYEDEQEKMRFQKNEYNFYAKSWKNQMQLKELQNLVVNMENHGMIPRAKSFITKKEPTSPVTITNISADTKDEEKIEKPKKITKNISYHDKARLLKKQIEEKEKSSYQFKIKKLIQEARTGRKSGSSSPAPKGILRKSEAIES
jgi:hypothetical protein